MNILLILNPKQAAIGRKINSTAGETRATSNHLNWCSSYLLKKHASVKASKSSRCEQEWCIAVLAPALISLESHYFFTNRSSGSAPIFSKFSIAWQIHIQ